MCIGRVSVWCVGQLSECGVLYVGGFDVLGYIGVGQCLGYGLDC